MTRPEPGKRILLVMHQAHSTPGKVGAALRARGYALDACRPQQGERLPDSLEPYAASIVFGGPQSATDTEMQPELSWLEKTALPADKPLLGICLGAQALAKVLGADVRRCSEGHVEIGYYDVHPVAPGDAFLPETTRFYQWHSDTFSIPRSAVHLARSTACDGQAFRYGAAYGIEFHPEMTFEMVHRWCNSERGSKKLLWPGAQRAEAHYCGYGRHSPKSDRWLATFLDHLLAGT